MSDNFVIRTRSFCMNRFLSLDKWEALCISMQYKIELMYTFGIFFFFHLYNIFFYQMIIMLKSEYGPNFFITANSLSVKDSLEQTVSL